MKCTIYCLGCKTILGYDEINLAIPFATPTQGWCDKCVNRRDQEARAAVRRVLAPVVSRPQE